MADTNESSGRAASPRRLITVFGGTGFLGRRVVQHLLGHEFDVRAVSRHPQRTASVSNSGLTSFRADVHNEAEVAAALEGAYGSVNAVSLYVEHGQDTFRAVHVDAAARVARLACGAGVEHLAHVSGIGSDPGSSFRYIKARGQGELAVQRAFANATLVRPSVMFGPDDAFLTTLVKMVRFLHVCPMFGRGETKLQPVHVDDVAEAVARLMANTAGLTRPCYEFGGPQVYTYEELLRTISRHLGTSTRFIPIPFALWHLLATVAEYVPGAPMTRDQIALLQNDNVASPHFPGLLDLGVKPTPVEAVLNEVGRRAVSGSN
jgi:NADH dehydrogenase